MAEKAWLKHQPPIEAVLAALEWQVPLWEKSERSYTPLPATYINGGRWMDERPRDARGFRFSTKGDLR